MIRKITLFAVLAIYSLSAHVFAQKGGRNIYNWGAGVRMEFIGSQGNNPLVPGPYIGGAFKYLVDPQKNFEILALTDMSSGLEAHALFAIFNPFPEIPQNFRYFFGGGVHAGRWAVDRVPPFYNAGVDGQLGVEFIGRKIPLSLSFEWHPVYHFLTRKGESSSRLMSFGLALKYTYKR